MKSIDKTKSNKVKKYLSTANSKLKETSKEFQTKIASFDIPDNETRDGRTICIGADKCKAYCYAGKGFYKVYPSVSDAQHTRLEMADSLSLVSQITTELNAGKSLIEYVRMHSAGDFYSREYLNKWIDIADKNHKKRFYAYTKSIPLFLQNFRESSELIQLPENFDITFSFGGKFDKHIKEAFHKHTKIFNSKEELENAGYVDASKHDLYATKWHNNDSKNVGLIMH